MPVFDGPVTDKWQDALRTSRILDAAGRVPPGPGGDLSEWIDNATKEVQSSDDRAYFTADALAKTALWTSILGPLVWGRIAGARMRSAKQLTEAEVPVLLKSMKTDHLPTVRIPGLKNAFYGRLRHLGPYARKLTPEQRDMAREHGVIAYDPNLRSEAVLAHEAGHAAISEGRRGKLSKFNQNVLRPVGALGFPLSFLTYKVLADRSTSHWLPVVGAATTVGAGFLPTLISEYQASKAGLEGLDSLYKDQEIAPHVARARRRRNRRALIAAGSTYGMSAGLLSLFVLAARHRERLADTRPPVWRSDVMSTLTSLSTGAPVKEAAPGDP